MSTTPEAIVGLDLEGKGFKEVYQQLNQQVAAWDRIEGLTGRIAAHTERFAGHVGALAGIAGIGGLLSDWMRLATVSGAIAQNVGYIRGDASYKGPAGALRGAAIATSTDSRELGAALASMTGTLPGGSLGALGGQARTLGTYSQAYGVDVGTLGSLSTSIMLAQGQGMGALPGVLGTAASQAQRAGMAGQTGLFLQSVAGVTSAIGSAHPGGANPGIARGIGAMYGAAASANPAFRDPSTFGAGVLGIDQGVSQAYQNPRMEAVLQAAGVGYWDQRYGLAGKHGRETAQKLLAWSDKVYGHGSIEQDVFLRSQFGDVSADLLKAFAKGQVTYDQLMHTSPHGEAPSQLHQRAAVGEGTPASRGQKAREQAGGAASGPLDAILSTAHKLGLDTLPGGIALYGGYKLGKGLLKRVGAARAAAAAQGSARAATAAAEHGGTAAAEHLTAREATQRMLERGGLAGGEHAAGTVAERAGTRAILSGAGLAAGAIALAPLDVAAFYFTMGTHDLDAGAAVESRNIAAHKVADLSKQFGAKWYDNPKAWQALRDQGLWGKGHPQIQGGVKQPGFFLGAYAQAARAHDHAAGPHAQVSHPAHGGHGADARFDAAVRRFERAVAALAHPGSARSLNAGNLQDLNSQVGDGMVFASMVTSLGASGSSGAPGSQFASVATGGAPTFGGGAGGGGAGGGQPCTLTWYDPALGGTNSGNGKANPHSPTASGTPYSATAMTCAAPSNYAFGTRIAFSYGGKTVTCTVNDRGGAITGNHFDLARAPAQALGIVSAGRVRGTFRVLGSGGQQPRAPSGGGGSTSHGGPTSQAASASWLSDGGGGVGAGGGAHAMIAGKTAIHVHIDGRQVDAMKRLTRGRA